MVRSAAKNHAHVAIVTDPGDYAELLTELDTNDGRTSFDFRRKLAAKAFALTAAYDSTISQWFAFADQGERLPRQLDLLLNPQDATAIWREPAPDRRRCTCPSALRPTGSRRPTQVQGKELSYNNLNDANAALELVAEFRDGPPTVVIVKHANPCGVATRRQSGRRMARSARLRQRLRLRRDRRDQPAPRCSDRGSDR